MRSPLFLATLAAATVLGLLAGLFGNHLIYGRYSSHFGPYSIGSDVTPANLASFVNLDDDGDGGRLEIVGDQVFDFGTMSVGESGEHLFKIRNVGKSDLSLAIGESTCKCTLGNLETDKLPPGEETEVKLSWTVKTNADRFGQQAELLTNDPSKGAVPLRIVGRVIREYEFEPKTLRFGSVTPGESIDVETTLYNYSQYELRMTSTRITSDEIEALTSVEITPIEKSDFSAENQDASQGFRIAVHIEPGIPQGSVSQNLIVGFKRFTEDGSVVPLEDSGNIVGDDLTSRDEIAIYVPLQGTVVDTVRMVTNSKLRRKNGGGYLYLLDRIPAGEVTKGAALILLKGDDRENMDITVQSVYPEGFVTAKIGDVKHQSTMSLVPVEFEIDPKGKNLDYQGLAGDDKSYGRIMLSTDKENKATMPLYLKFVTEEQ